ncbi:rod shape-determining protein MreC [Thermosyntropha sp.]|uniref:rod shape-determining protein MreC n=1 Tax=Thermosyntropha sp. TaxID=2740820 RepID=UPI0025D7D3E5|nr:rod shape-determining protein MreC [Thermosyntropha sp.]MBO8158787.1 rod shape-determining protein MreC [Thermosyntropha sp.]
MRSLMKKRYFWIIVSIIVISLFFIKVSSYERRDITIIENWVCEAYTPLFSGVSGIRDAFSSLEAFFEDRRMLKRTIDELKHENEKLRLENQTLKEYKTEAERLQNILDFKNTSLETYSLTAARVVGRSPNNWYQGIIIDKGKNNGLTKGMPVISPEGLVGIITNTSHNVSYVSLLTDRSTAIGVLVQESRETNGIVEGTGNSNTLRMTNIPYYSNIKKNYHVITSGLSQIYPKGIMVGKVEEIYHEPGGLLLSADIKPAVNFDKLEEVLVITDYKKPPNVLNEEQD